MPNKWFFRSQLGRSDCLTSSCFRLHLLNMKSATLNFIAATIIIAAPAAPKLIGQAQENRAKIRYSVISLGTLGGSGSNGFGGVNNRRWVTGDANLAGDQTEHAALWRDGEIVDLGTLGGLNSSVANPMKDDRGLIVGGAQTAIVDPLGEFWGANYFCTAANCEGWQNLQGAFLWRDGVISALPGLGGNNSSAAGANSRGQIVGTAETAYQDPNCITPQVLDYEPVVWGPEPGQIQVLPLLPGDSVGIADGINDEGVMVGWTGPCGFPGLSGAPFLHSVLWRDGTVTYLGGLGGLFNNAANAINNKGQVVGQSDVPDDSVTHAFLWQDGVMTDLGTLPGVEVQDNNLPDITSLAEDINNKGQIVGPSCDVNFNCRVFLWENGVMTDLNALIPPDSPLYLYWGAGINDRGEIAGSACILSNGVCTSESTAFLAVPCDDAHAGYEGCADSSASPVAAAQAISDRPRAILPESIRQRLQNRGFGRFAGGPGTGTVVAPTVSLPSTSQTAALSDTGTVVEFNPSILHLYCRTPCPPPWQSATLTNKGNTPLAISSIGITGTRPGNPFNFVEVNNCPRTLGGNQFCTISVHCNPPPLPHMPSVGSASVSVTDNGAGSPQQLTVVCIRFPTF
jgi:probable HAF family extracellular repeat protein